MVNPQDLLKKPCMTRFAPNHPCRAYYTPKICAKSTKKCAFSAIETAKFQLHILLKINNFLCFCRIQAETYTVLSYRFVSSRIFAARALEP